MTDKEQVIIDGVDVSGCRHFLKDTEGQDYNTDEFVKGCCEAKGCYIGCEFIGYSICRGDKDCYFKQLARKTQECEQIKEKYEALKLENQEGYEIVAELKQECEELKEKNKNLRCMYESMSELCGIKDEALIDKQADIDELSHHCFEYSDRIYCYRKVLKEIERYCSIKNDPDIQDVPYRIIAPVILDIINKAKDGNNEKLI